MIGAKGSCAPTSGLVVSWRDPMVYCVPCHWWSYRRIDDGVFADHNAAAFEDDVVKTPSWVTDGDGMPSSGAS